MGWIDAIVILIVIFVTVLEALRSSDGLSLPLFDVIGAWLAVKVTGLFYDDLARIAGWSEFTSYLMLIVVLFVALAFLAKWAHNQAMLTLDTFDSILGTLCGFVTGGLIAHAVLRLMLLANPAEEKQIQQCWACRQVLYVEAFKRAGKTMEELGEY